MNRLLRWRPSVSQSVFIVAVSAYLLAVFNFTFWHKTVAYFGPHPELFWLFAIGITGLMTVIVSLFSLSYLTKPLIIFLILVGAVAAFYTDNYGTIISRQMIENAVTTTAHEAKHLITWQFIAYVAVFGLLPSALVAWVRIRPVPFRRRLLQRAAILVIALAAVALPVTVNYPAFSSTWREHQDLMASFTPAAPIASAVKYGVVAWREAHAHLEPIGQDARRTLPVAGRKPVLAIMVIGETARAANFSLDGYARETNPELKKRDIINFTNASSCGTSTAVSVPCMFSEFTRANYSEDAGRSYENLLDVMQHAGMRAEWWDNNTGSKGVAARAPTRVFTYETDPKYCEDGECRDEIMVDALPAFFDSVKGDTVLVIHQIGSHGPTYHLRYTKPFERFTPVCRTATFAECTHDEIVNAYDNTILYTDHVLARIIDMLNERQGQFTSMMFYASDHGESLGENGLYLHGVPYFLAPSEQTHIPFMFWLSNDLAEEREVDTACLKSHEDAPVSHDNVFHSMLGLMDIDTSVYHRDLDIFASCRDRAAQISAGASASATN
ncbi:MAG: phosphoethanolamine--lipid A transferase [Rhodobiaceae bacterium]|nr:phosphoethanolamine--lipid A transferase [Rhodobiaceae bacterium]MCC0057103.1 phosphoethanolamine--lipid A transferase [Rhodobiaceae bacterium]